MRNGEKKMRGKKQCGVCAGEVMLCAPLIIEERCGLLWLQAPQVRVRSVDRRAWHIAFIVDSTSVDPDCATRHNFSLGP